MAKPEITRKKVQIDKSARPAIERSKAKILRIPRLETMFEEDDVDPLENVEYPGDLQGDADAEMSEIARQIVEQRRSRRELFRIQNDPDYYFIVCFQSYAQKEEFLRKWGLYPPKSLIINGVDLAQKLGIDIQVIDLKPPKLRGKPHKYSREEVV